MLVQQAQRRALAEEEAKLKDLQQFFPTWDKEALREVLSSSGGNSEAAAQTLLEWTSDFQAQASSRRTLERAKSTRRESLRLKAGPISPWHERRAQDELVEALQKEFDKMDRNHDGVLDHAELSAAFKVVNAWWTSEDTVALMRVVDANGDGLVHFDEFRQWILLGGKADQKEAKPVPLPRAEFDRVIANRLSRSCSVGMFKVLKSVLVWKRQLLGRSPPDPGVPKLSSLLDEELARKLEKQSMSREDQIKEGSALLKERCKFLGMTSTKIGDDGNCQFRAVSHELFGTQEHHGMVRERIAALLWRSKDQYAGFFEGDQWSDHVKRLQQPGEWGDELSLQACAEAFGVRVHIISSESENWYLVYEPTKGLAPNAREIFLTYVAPVHYESLVPLR